jgi:hypothetical protein
VTPQQQRTLEALVEQTAAAAFPGEYAMWATRHPDWDGGLWSVSVSPDTEGFRTVWVSTPVEFCAVVAG